MMHQKLEYMHNNPAARGYVDNPLPWRYSSARKMEGEAEMVVRLIEFDNLAP